MVNKRPEIAQSFNFIIYHAANKSRRAKLSWSSTMTRQTLQKMKSLDTKHFEITLAN